MAVQTRKIIIERAFRVAAQRQFPTIGLGPIGSDHVLLARFSHVRAPPTRKSSRLSGCFELCPMLEAALGRRKLRSRILRGHQHRPQFNRFGMLPAVPAEMLSRHRNPGVLAVELVHGFEELKNDLCLGCAQEWRGEFFMTKERIDITENPWCALCGAAEHYSFCASEIKYRASFLRRVDVAVGDQRNVELTACARNRFVFRSAAKKIGTRSPMHAERGDAAGLR